ncbi:MAG: methanethiol S-methyltransferase [Planctomycetota bacterium]
MSRLLFFIYGVGGHVVFLATYVYMAGFVGNLWVPKSIDSPDAPFTAAGLVINVFLMALFCVQHSVMARPGFKRRWTRVVPEVIERSTYVWISCAVTVLMMWQWRPMGPVVWDLTDAVTRGVAYGLFAFGWLMVPLVSFMINHFDLFGNRQVWLHLRGRRYEPLELRAPGAYKFVRHPLYVGWMIAFWATPTMTVGHLLFAGVLTLYMLVAIPIEERDLVAAHGKDYAEYRDRVPALVPGFGKSPTPKRRSRLSSSGV